MNTKGEPLQGIQEQNDVVRDDSQLYAHAHDVKWDEERNEYRVVDLGTCPIRWRRLVPKELTYPCYAHGNRQTGESVSATDVRLICGDYSQHY